MRLAVLSFALCANPVQSEPMWQLADNWICKLERHMRAPSGEEIIEMAPGDQSFRIDFVSQTVSSAFVEGTAPTISRDYYESQQVNYNILVNDWGYGKYPSIIMEQDARFWSVSGSGSLETGDSVWIAIYECIADELKS